MIAEYKRHNIGESTKSEQKIEESGLLNELDVLKKDLRKLSFAFQQFELFVPTTIYQSFQHSLFYVM